jgi:alkylation response protein AidB-like acyl-CoA dehydrogenase
MDLRYSPEDVEFREAVRRWLAANVPSEEPRTPEARRAWHARLYEAGYVGMGWPVAYGGGGASPIRQAIVAAEMARAGAPASANSLGLAFIGPTIMVHGTEAQKRRYLRKILTAEELWCQLYSEPDAGSDLASLRTRAEDHGDHFLVTGQKIWTSGGLIADRGLLLARSDPAAPKHQGISCLLISMRQPGVEVRPLRQITGSAHFAEVFLTGARVDKEDVLGQPGQGWEIAQTTLSYERGGSSLARVTRYATAFRQLLRAVRAIRRGGRPLIEDPVVRVKLGRIYAELEVQRYNALRVLSTLEKGESPGAAASITKLSYSEFEKRYHEAVQEILGPWGQVMGTPADAFGGVETSSGEAGTWATAFLWSRAGTIYAGSSEIQKNIVGERVLGLPREARADRPRPPAAAPGGAR